MRLVFFYFIACTSFPWMFFMWRQENKQYIKKTERKNYDELMLLYSYIVVDFSKEWICKFNTFLTSITGGARMEAISHSYVPWIHFQVWWESQTSFYCNIDCKTAFFHSSTCHGKLRNINHKIYKCMKNMKYILYSVFFHAHHEFIAAKYQLLFITL